MDETHYALGRTAAEYDRLTEQGELLRPMTERMLRAAGITADMNVLDFGCGAGDVAVLLSTMVGPKGRVTGLDVDPEAARLATRRCASLGIENVAFIAGDLRSDELSPQFDAVVGRLALMYVSDPTDALRAMAARIRPGGVIAFLEWVADISARTTRDAPVLASLQDLIRRTHSRSGASIEMGAELYERMRDAGLEPAPRPLAEIVLAAGQGLLVHRRWASVVRSLLPTMVRYELATENEVTETVERRLLEEVTNAHGLLPLSWPMIGQWSRKP
jgi:ubiquinone/menaquinone biosynthesis C-methylase UbiE